MASDFEIGRVVAVDTSEITVELNADLRTLTRVTYERTVEIGRVNSYVIVPVGARRIVAMITRVVMTEESEIKADRTMIALPSAKRLMKATMIGTIEGSQFKQGISLFPVLDSPVLVTAEGDLDAIFGTDAQRVDPTDPGYCIDIGTAVVFPDYHVRINPDTFFGKHAAIIGSTGTGKSCTIASILQSILEKPEVHNTRFIILDTNGEYRSAFQTQNTPTVWVDAREQYRSLYIPTDPNEGASRLVIPYWFMNSDDFVRLFRAAPNIQRPVLLEALRIARTGSHPQTAQSALRELLIKELFELITTLEDATNKTSADVEDRAKGTHSYLDGHKETLKKLFTDEGKALLGALQTTAAKAAAYVSEPAGRRFSKLIPLNVREELRLKLQESLDQLLALAPDPSEPSVSADTPVFFGKEKFRHEQLEKAMRKEEAGGARTKDHCATMLMRIHRLLEDRRFDFLFGPLDSEWPEPDKPLAAFLRDLLGMLSGSPLSSEAKIAKSLLPFYDRQRDHTYAQSRNVVIVDLSLLSTEILENITALIGRLLLEFLQRMGNSAVSGVSRGAFPVVLILEEAQNYIREGTGPTEDSISRQTYERIAREGRKFGLSLVVASQRPSELSKTVLSQCSSFIVHRLQNPEDLWYFKQIVPGIYTQLLNQLPALAPQHALVLGDAVQAPALVRIRDVDPTPLSKDPKFYEKWVSEQPPVPNVEAICDVWEGRKPTDAE